MIEVSAPKEASLPKIDEPLVSLIMPVYCTPVEHVSRMADSILRQPYQNFELLMVDDGCDEEYAIKLEDVANRDGRIRLIHAPHGGVSAARNIGLDAMAGDYVMFVDSDDEILPSGISRAVEYAQDYELDAVLGGEEYVYADYVESSQLRFADGEIVHVFTNGDREKLSKYFFSIEGVREMPQITGLPRGPFAKLYSRDVVQDVRFDTALNIYEDTVFTAFALRQASRIGIVDECWYRYYQNSYSAVHKLALDDAFSAHAEAIYRLALDNDVQLSDYHAHIRHYFQQAVEQESLRGEKGLFGRMRSTIAKPFCRDAFHAGTFTEFDLSGKRRVIQGLCRCNLLFPVYALYAIRRVLNERRGNMAIQETTE